MPISRMTPPQTELPRDLEAELRKELQDMDVRDLSDVLAFLRFIALRKGKYMFKSIFELMRGAWVYYRFHIFGKA